VNDPVGIGFIIMQIGDENLDRVCRDAIVPALSACGLEPKRVDKHNEGGLLKSEIISFIGRADIIVADVTNERPNCYLEIGYTMGVDKLRNLILTAREDHNQDSPNHKPAGPKVHFDLAGYDVLFWDPAKVEEFRAELEKRIRRRQLIIAPEAKGVISPWDEQWIEERRKEALAGLQRMELSAYMEVAFTLSRPKLSKNQLELLDAAERSVIHTSGWPFALVMTKDELRPRPRSFGIVAEIPGQMKASYDYWSIKVDGDFYLLRSFWEDPTHSDLLWFNVRINEVTEALLYCARLYSRLGVESTSTVSIKMRHVGLKGRRLEGTERRRLHWERKVGDDECFAEITIPLARIESELITTVKAFTGPLFALFDFFKLDDNVYEDIVNGFVAGKPS
jgi:hypothetical protein